MKRYTGQKALYEVISRSRAKTKRGSILERLLPESAKQEKGPLTHNGVPKRDESRLGGPSAVGNPKPPVPAGVPPAESKDAPAEPPTGREPSRPVGQGPSTHDPALGNPERLYEAVAGPENAELQRIEKVEETEMPAQEPAVPPGNADLLIGSFSRANREIGGPRDPELRAMEEANLPAPVRNIPMWWRLKPLQLNEGRIEISVSYHIGIAVALAVILVILAGFRLGQRYSGAKAGAPVQTDAPARAAAPDAVTTAAAEKTPSAGAQGAGSPAGEPAQPQGDNWIVLVARHKNEADLEPVVAHFAQSGIALKIYELGWLRQYLDQYGFTAAGLPSGEGYMLVTSDLYHNPQNPETDGYRMRQKIAAVGATYRPEKGRDPFTPKLFSDAYGMKISRVK